MSKRNIEPRIRKLQLFYPEANIRSQKKTYPNFGEINGFSLRSKTICFVTFRTKHSSFESTGNFQNKKFPSLEIFFLLFGFFLGNLSPQGFAPLSFDHFFSENSKNLFQESKIPILSQNIIPANKELTKRDFWHSPEKSLSAKIGDSLPSGEKTIDLLDSSYRLAKLEKQDKILIFTKSILKNFEPLTNFSGPTPTILFCSEFLNWIVFSRSPLAHYFRKSKIIEKQINENENKSYSKIPKVKFPLESKKFLHCLNSTKIGFLLGIFVDAFKVGS